jgi:hypothetical protein
MMGLLKNEVAMRTARTSLALIAFALLFAPAHDGSVFSRAAIAQASPSKRVPLLGTNFPVFIFEPYMPPDHFSIVGIPPTEGEIKGAKQIEILQENQKAADDLKIVFLLEAYGRQTASSLKVVERLTPQDGDQVFARRRFHVAPADFTVILVGKDGQELLRSSEPIRFDQLRAAIERIP